MKQYIDKDVLVAEIERLINSNKPLKTLDPTYCEGLDDSLDNVLSFIDTLEVKEVDLEKEIKSFTMSNELYEADSAIKAVAEHFFELGINTKNE